MNRALAFLFWYDFLARPYDPTRGQFTGPDQKAEEYYPWNQYAFCGNNPLKYVDPNGNVVKPFGKYEIQMIKNTLPKEMRKFVKLDNNGFIDQELLNSCSSYSYNLENLKMLVNSKLTIEVYLNDSFEYANKEGIIGTATMQITPFDPLYPEDIDLKGETISGVSTGETGFLGKTLFPDRVGEQNSSNNNLMIIVNSGLSSAGAAEMYSHEANGHALLYIKNGYDHIGASHQVVNMVDYNVKLRDMILRSKQETIKNMQE